MKIWGLQRKFGVSNENIRVSNENLGGNRALTLMLGFYKAETNH